MSETQRTPATHPRVTVETGPSYRIDVCRTCTDQPWQWWVKEGGRFKVWRFAAHLADLQAEVAAERASRGKA